jgi:hypothetical protein
MHSPLRIAFIAMMYQNYTSASLHSGGFKHANYRIKADLYDGQGNQFSQYSWMSKSSCGKIVYLTAIIIYLLVIKKVNANSLLS